MSTGMKGLLTTWSVLLLLALPAQAQYLVISAEQLRDRMQSGKNAVIIDVRPREEYLSGHVPGAINIPAERMGAEHRRLPRDKSTLLVFYCRGAG